MTLIMLKAVCIDPFLLSPRVGAYSPAKSRATLFAPWSMRVRTPIDQMDHSSYSISLPHNRDPIHDIDWPWPLWKLPRVYGVDLFGVRSTCPTLKPTFYHNTNIDVGSTTKSMKVIWEIPNYWCIISIQFRCSTLISTLYVHSSQTPSLNPHSYMCPWNLKLFHPGHFTRLLWVSTSRPCTRQPIYQCHLPLPSLVSWSGIAELPYRHSLPHSIPLMHKEYVFIYGESALSFPDRTGRWS